jgi:hypothetical protein
VRGGVGKTRNPVMVLLISMLCFVYALIEGLAMLKELMAFRGKQDINLIFFLIPILNILEVWKLPAKVLEAKQMAGVHNAQVAHPILYLFLGLYFLPADLNEVWQAAGGGQQTLPMSQSRLRRRFDEPASPPRTRRPRHRGHRDGVHFRWPALLPDGAFFRHSLSGLRAHARDARALARRLRGGPPLSPARLRARAGLRLRDRRLALRLRARRTHPTLAARGVVFGASA